MKQHNEQGKPHQRKLTHTPIKADRSIKNFKTKDTYAYSCYIISPLIHHIKCIISASALINTKQLHFAGYKGFI